MHHITERERERKGAEPLDRGWFTDTQVPELHTPIFIHLDSSTGGWYAAVTQKSPDLAHACWTYSGLTARGYFRRRDPLVLPGGGVTLGAVVTVSFQATAALHSCIGLIKALPRNSGLVGCNLKIWLASKLVAGCRKTFKSGMWSMTLMLFWICQCAECAASRRGVCSSASGG